MCTHPIYKVYSPSVAPFHRHTGNVCECPALHLFATQTPQHVSRNATAGLHHVGTRTRISGWSETLCVQSKNRLCRHEGAELLSASHVSGITLTPNDVCLHCEWIWSGEGRLSLHDNWMCVWLECGHIAWAPHISHFSVSIFLPTLASPDVNSLWYYSLCDRT